MYRDFNFYIDFNWEQYINHQPTYFKDLYKMLRLAYMHQVNVFYSRPQLSEFLQHCGDLDEKFTSSVGNQLDIVLENASAINDIDQYIFSVQFAGSASYLMLVDIDAYKHIKPTPNNCLISLNEPIGTLNFLRVRNNDVFDRVTCQIVSDSDSIVAFLATTGEPRIFHFSSKHGEGGVGHWQGAAPMLCTVEEAQVLLNQSIIDFSEKFRFFKFDEDKDTYIEFFFEGDNTHKQWHGFHITPPEYSSRVPSAIRRHFGK